MSKLGPGGLLELLRVPPGQRHPTFDPNPSSPYGSGQVPGTPTGYYPAAAVGGMTGSFVGGIPHMGINTYGGLIGPTGFPIWNPITPTPNHIVPNMPTTPVSNVPPAPPAPANIKE